MADDIEEEGGTRFRSSHEETNVENAPLLDSESSESRNAPSGSGGGWKQMESKTMFSCSMTTSIGLILLLAMMGLTILSVCLQRYSSNKYIDIIVPSNGTANNGTAETTL